MAINLELKISIISYEKLIENIYLNNIELNKTLLQKDIYYKFDKGLLKLREQNGEFQLVKYNRNEKGKDRWSHYSLLFLRGDNIEEYLNDLFEVEVIVEKERKLFLYKNTRIHLDKVKYLGNYLELETVVEGISKEEAIIEFQNVVNFLELDMSTQIKKSYRDLMMEK